MSLTTSTEPQGESAAAPPTPASSYFSYKGQNAAFFTNREGNPPPVESNSPFTGQAVNEQQNIQFNTSVDAIKLVPRALVFASDDNVRDESDQLIDVIPVPNEDVLSEEDDDIFPID
ncbi:hypothetical protein PCE1_003673 [Barthelona sp. PCE]